MNRRDKSELAIVILASLLILAWAGWCVVSSLPYWWDLPDPARTE